MANPPGQRVDIGSIKLHIYCEGEGQPTVILESGLGGFSLDWSSVQQSLAGQVRVCAWDRAGYGWSDPGPSPRATDQIVEELEALLEIAQIPGPYVLVGHSFGGFTVQYFAKRNPGKVAGLVLIESSHPEQSTRIPDIPKHRERSRNSERISTSFNINVLDLYPQQQRHAAGKILTSMKSIMTQQREFLNFNQSGVQVGQGGRLPDVPLLVITRGQRVWPNDPYGNNLERIWSEMQKEFLALTTDSWQVIAEHSGHLVHLEQPEFVAESVRALLDRICGNPVNNVNQNSIVAFQYCVTL